MQLLNGQKMVRYEVIRFKDYCCCLNCQRLTGENVVAIHVVSIGLNTSTPITKTRKNICGFG